MGANRLQEREPVPGRSSHVDLYLSLQPLQEKLSQLLCCLNSNYPDTLPEKNALIKCFLEISQVYQPKCLHKLSEGTCKNAY